MAARLTVDGDYRIIAIEVVTKASPYSLCPDIAPRFQQLVGARMSKGWSKTLAEKVGGLQGCTHINELLRLMATIAFQTIAGDSFRRAREGGNTSHKVRSNLIDSCHALASNSPVIAKYWPEFYQPDLDKSQKLD
jgi:hypothetical protein